MLKPALPVVEPSHLPSQEAPEGRFQLEGVVSIEEARRLDEMETEIARLHQSVLKYRSGTIAGNFSRSMEVAADSPSVEGIDQMMSAGREKDANFANPSTAGKARRLAEKMVWNYFHAHVKPFVLCLIDRGLERLKDEHAAQIERERLWPEMLEWCERWYHYFGCTLPLRRPDELPSFRLACLIEDAAIYRGNIALRHNEASGRERPDSPASLVARVGINLPSVSTAETLA